MNKVEGLRIPDGLVPQPQNWKVLSITRTPGSVFRRGEWTQGGIEVATIIPDAPRIANPLGFVMMLVRVDNGKLSEKPTDSVRLKYWENLGTFVLDGCGFNGVYLDVERSFQQYVKNGYGLRIRALKQATDDRRGVLSARDARQEDWERAAQGLTPFLARFFDLTPDEQPM